MWWGPIDEMLHLFETLTLGPGSAIRNGSPAKCGWNPDMPLLESPEEPYRSALCKACLDLAPPIERIEQIRWLQARATPTTPGGTRISEDIRFLLEQIDTLHQFVHGHRGASRG